MVSIRLKPVGKKHQISFRIVVAHKRSKQTGRFIEDLGWYNPHTDKSFVKEERAKYWLSVGAQPTDTVFNIFVNHKIVEGPKKPKHKKSKKRAEAPEAKESQGRAAEPEQPQAEQPQPEASESQEDQPQPENKEVETKEQKPKPESEEQNQEDKKPESGQVQEEQKQEPEKKE